jgi:hypothetical protein
VRGAGAGAGAGTGTEPVSCADSGLAGLLGYSRLVPGDTYEIVLKHGNQKWRSRGRICKDGVQDWSFPRATFRGILGEVVYIKAAEVKLLSNQILLGNKFCEISELMSPHPQLMTVNLNPSGSLKVNIGVKWW